MEIDFKKKIYLKPLLIAAVCFLLFILIAIEVRAGNITHIDEKVLTAFRHKDNYAVPYGYMWLLPLMQAITVLGNTLVITFITLLITVYYLIKKNYTAMLIILTVIIGGALIDLLLKGIFERNRPVIVPHLVDATSWSFPSGHSVMSVVVFSAIAVTIISVTKKNIFKKYIIAGAALIFILVGFSRVYLGVHYPSDVVAGWLIGIGWWSLYWAIYKRFYYKQ